MPRQMIETARARNDGLLGCEPGKCRNTCGDLGAGLDVRRLHIDGAYTQLLVTEKALEMVRHVVFDQVGVAIDPATRSAL